MREDEFRDFAAACAALMEACGGLISRDVEDAPLRDARSLMVDVLMRSVGVRLVVSSSFLGGAIPDAETCVRVRRAVHDAFGAPGDWSGAIGDALRRIYR